MPAALNISPALTSLRRAQGASNGVYLAVDYALAVECLPNPDDKAKDLVRVCPHLPDLAAALGAAEA